MPKDVVKDLDPAFSAKLDVLLKACAARTVTMVPYNGVRHPADQARLWRQSRTTAQVNAAIQMLKGVGAPFLADVLASVGPQNGPEVTKALPGNSWHQWALAVDCYWLVDGKAEWSVDKLVNGVNGYRVMLEEAKRLGLTPGGAWTTIQDWPHVQMPSDDNPIKSGKTWPQIDQKMRELFSSGPMIDVFDGEAPTGHVRDGVIKLYVGPSSAWTLWTSEQRDVVLFRARMTICADGCPKAYHKDGTPPGLDYLANAGSAGNWWGIATDKDGEPFIQTSSDPAPGFYVSTTALPDGKYQTNDPRRYVDANTIPFMVMPGGDYVPGLNIVKRARKGDFAAVLDLDTGEVYPAIWAEVGPPDKAGEASMYLARDFGVNDSPTHGGVSKRRFVYCLFPGTGNRKPRTLKEIQEGLADALEKWGGEDRLHDLAKQIP